jgi:hypothetical protein
VGDVKRHKEGELEQTIDIPLFLENGPCPTSKIALEDVT